MDCPGCDDCVFDTPDIPPDLHEIHITVQTRNPDRFREVCEENDIKPIIIAYQRLTSSVAMEDVMTSHGFKGSLEGAMEEMHRVARLLENHEFPVIRRKIEVSPTNPITQGGMGYWEAHLGIRVPEGWDETFTAACCMHPNMHRSRNPLKVDRDGTRTIMLTHRTWEGTHAEVRDTVQKCKESFEKTGFDVEKVIVEYAWFDDKVKHDDPWMKE